MSLVGSDGKPLQGVRVEAKKGECVLCVAQRRRTAAAEGVREPGIDDAYEQGLALGYYVGLQLMGSVLAACGLPLDKTAQVQELASCLCADHLAECVAFDVGETHRPAVERAIANIRAGNVFMVGRDAAGNVRGGT